jgi:hypothetical protein
MQKISVHIEFRAVTPADGGGRARLRCARVIPPGAGCLARQRNHRVHENKRPNGHTSADESRGEPSQRLSDQDDILPCPDRSHDQIRIVNEARTGIVTRQIDGDRLSPRLLQAHHGAMPIRCHAAGPGNEHERA